MGKASYILVAYKAIPTNIINTFQVNGYDINRMYDHAYLINGSDMKEECDNILDIAKNCVLASNYLFVAKLTGNAAWNGIINPDWVKKHMVKLDDKKNTPKYDCIPDFEKNCIKHVVETVDATPVTVTAKAPAKIPIDNLDNICVDLDNELNDMFKNMGL